MLNQPVCHKMVSQEEAQRLINISLGKIASYRNQRGSSNLHKNVLVANVLRRVRNTAVEEESFYQVSNVNSSQALTNVCENTCTEDSVNAKPNDVFGRLAIHAGDVTMSHGDSDVGDFLVEGCEENESPNNTTDFSATDDISENVLAENTVMRTKSVKRRLPAAIEDCVSVKRRRECNSDESMRWRVTRRLSVSDCDGDTETDNIDSSNDQESHVLDSRDTPMDVEQICGLVSVFRSSFQGLGYLGSATTEQINSRDAGSYPTSKTEGRQNCSLRRGLSLPDLCAKQAVDGLSRQPFKMCTPALALTV
uniref:Early growth response 2 n=1 Tax=Hadrurus spadix TaxID=141984 RepID=A0A1W7RAP1_9SCOR